VAARPREAGHVAGSDRVRVAHEDDGDRRGRPFRRLGVDGTWYDDDIDLEPNKFLRQFAHPFWFPLRPPVLDGDVPTLHVAQVAKPLPKSFGGFRKRGRTVPQKTDAVDLRRLLRMRGEWRKNETDSENDREPDQPHGHLGGRRLAGSLAERPDAHQRPGLDNHRGAGYLSGRRDPRI